MHSWADKYDDHEKVLRLTFSFRWDKMADERHLPLPLCFVLLTVVLLTRGSEGNWKNSIHFHFNISLVYSVCSINFN